MVERNSPREDLPVRLNHTRGRRSGVENIRTSQSTIPNAYMSLAHDALPVSNSASSKISSSGAIHRTVPRMDDVTEKVSVVWSSVVKPKSVRQAFISALIRMLA